MPLKRLTCAVADDPLNHVVTPFIVDRICCLALYHHTHTSRAYAHPSLEVFLVVESLTHGHPAVVRSAQFVTLLFVVSVAQPFFVWGDNSVVMQVGRGSTI